MPWAIRLNNVLRAFGWAYEDLGNVFQVSPQTAYGWGHNQSIPHHVLVWIEGAEWAIRLEAVRRAFKWTYADLARVFQVSVSTAHGWCKYKQPIPASVKGWIQVWERVVEEQNQERQRQFANQLLEKTVIGGALLLAGFLLGRSTSTGSGKGASTGTGKDASTDSGKGDSK